MDNWTERNWALDTLPDSIPGYILMYLSQQEQEDLRTQLEMWVQKVRNHG